MGGLKETDWATWCRAVITGSPRASVKLEPALAALEALPVLVLRGPQFPAAA